MAQAKQVRSGQVWTAIVRGKRTEVAILRQASGASDGRRATFLWRNLKTGRTSSGTAGRLKTLVREAETGDEPGPVEAQPVMGPSRALREAEAGLWNPPTPPPAPPRMLGSLRTPRRELCDGCGRDMAAHQEEGAYDDCEPQCARCLNRFGEWYHKRHGWLCGACADAVEPVR